MLDPQSIQNIRFSTTRLREGYDQDEVDNFLDQVEDTLKVMEKQLRDTQSEAATLRRLRDASADAPTTVIPPVPAAPPSPSAEGILRLAQETADRHVAEAKAEADRIVREAGGKAAKHVEDGLAASKKLQDDAALEASRIRSEGLAERQKALDELEARHSQVSEALSALQNAGAKVRDAMTQAVATYDGRMTT